MLKENLFRMRDAMDQFYADKNKWPGDLERAGVRRLHPRDSRRSVHASRKTRGRPKQAEPDANNPASAVGIDNVFSGSEVTALDGTKYAEWD